MCRFVFFFFFKQKTAYEMRISDWSSDVCSSDLETHELGSIDKLVESINLQCKLDLFLVHSFDMFRPLHHFHSPFLIHPILECPKNHPTHSKRSEEHTSELQSLMRISYAVFCLKKKKHTHKQYNNNS